MTLLWFTLLLLAFHLFSYRLLLWKQWIKTEKNVFLFHVFSFVFNAFVALIAVLVSPDLTFAAWVASVGLHAVYSMTFLELWSVTQGSFFLSVMDAIADSLRNACDLNLHALHEIGRQKRLNRLAVLQQGKMLLEMNGVVSLSERGQRFSRIFSGLRWLMNVKRAG